MPNGNVADSQTHLVITWIRELLNRIIKGLLRPASTSMLIACCRSITEQGRYDRRERAVAPSTGIAEAIIKAAEAIYREDLKQCPKNGWSQFGWPRA